MDCVQKAQICLKSLFWQAGEQLEFLFHTIKTTKLDGKKFTMLVGFAYTILDGLDVAVDLSKIKYPENNNSFIIQSSKNIIKTRITYENIPDDHNNDYYYFKFLRSFICAHPLETFNPKTNEGFIQTKFAFCKCVDQIEPHHFFPKNINADYVAIILDNSENDYDIYINSKEIWTYVANRYNLVINVIYREMKERIIQVVEELKNTPINTDDTNSIKNIKITDSKRCCYYQKTLDDYNFVLNFINKSSLETRNKIILKKWIWDGIKKIQKNIQEMVVDDEITLFSRVNSLMKTIGCDKNQISNIHYINDFDQRDCELNPENYDYFLNHSLSPTKRIQFYKQIIVNLKNKNKKERIDFVSDCYFDNFELVNEEIARIYFIAVIPEFVEKYNLLIPLSN